MSTTTARRPHEPGVLDALSLLSEVLDELVVRSARDTHFAVADRTYGLLRRATGATGASVSEVVHRRVPEALIPGLDQVRTAGVVTLPGAFIGVLLGGGSPAQAAAAQVLVLMGIMAAQTTTAVVAERLIGSALLLPADLRASLQP